MPFVVLAIVLAVLVAVLILVVLILILILVLVLVLVLVFHVRFLRCFVLRYHRYRSIPPFFRIYPLL